MAEGEATVMPGAQSGPAPTPAVAPESAVPPLPLPPARRRVRTGLGGRLFLVLLAFGLAFVALGLTGKALRFPVWAVAEVESRMNRALVAAMPGAALSLGGVSLAVQDDWVPRFTAEDLRLLGPGGRTIAALPELRLSLDPAALLRGEVRARSLRMTGGRLDIARDADGRINLDLPLQGAVRLDSFGDLFAAMDDVFGAPALADLTRIEAEALSVTLADARSRRTWVLGDGRLVIENRPEAVAAELGATLAGGTHGPAQAVLTVVTEKAGAGAPNPVARVTAMVDGVAAADLAAQAAPLDWLKVLDAPISGQIAARLDASGVRGLDGRLTLGAGALSPVDGARPIAFDRAEMQLGYDAEAGRVRMTALDVESPALRLKATGQSYLVDDRGLPMQGPLGLRQPAAFLGQMAFSQVMIDPEGLFARPVRFSDGAIDLRLTLDPFRIEIGQVALSEGAQRLTGRGEVAADSRGWTVALDIGLNQMRQDELTAFWPVGLLPKTRNWIATNLLEAALFDVKAALRIRPGQDPRLSVGYEFAAADIRFLKSLPPVRDGRGHATIEDNRYAVVLAAGRIDAPQGGAVDVAGSVFEVPDMRVRPALGKVALQTRSSLTAALSLLDQEPFRFLTKADRPVDLGEGQADLRADITLPLVPRVRPQDVGYAVTGRVTGLATDRIVPGRRITAAALELEASPRGMAIRGPGQIGAVPFDVTYAQDFGPEAGGRARVTGTVTLSPAAVRDFGLGLPDGMVRGETPLRVDLALRKGAAPVLTLAGDLRGLALGVAEVGWTKPAAARARFEAQVTLGARPAVQRLALSAEGFAAEGTVTLGEGGGLDLARFTRVQVGQWLDASVDLRGRGKGRPIEVEVTGGEIDMRRMPARDGQKRGPGGPGTPVSLTLDRLRVTDAISFTGFSGRFTTGRGMEGEFAARVNGGPRVSGVVVPAAGGSALRIRSDNAGATLAAAGVFASAAGGSLDLRLTPRGPEGHYSGRAEIRNIRARNANVLAELLSAISVVGLLEQLNGEGILFGEADADFILTPAAIEVTRAAAVGASLGVSLAGLYRTADKRLDLQGVISPIYLVNGVGALISRRGEGLFGFNYSLGGTADNPRVRVNPLSILTPGMFRDIFRQPPPTLQGNG